MFNTTYDDLNHELIEQIKHQAEQSPEFSSLERRDCTDMERVACALEYGPQAIDNKILISISENINTMAQAINKSEEQKSTAREKYINFFKRLLIFLISVVTVLILSDTFFGVQVRLEFLISVMAAIIADVFAIVHTLVKYMTGLEHYKAYNQLINSLLQSINHKSSNDNK